MSLADANFTAQGHVRYGQDYYDERMQASRIAYVCRAYAEWWGIDSI